MLLKNPYCKNISQMSNKNICKLPQTSNFGSELLRFFPTAVLCIK